jgi:hopanoid biosynthesis associated protein HpnK
VVTGDDFGLDEAVNEGIEIAHRRGLLSAASLMVSGPAACNAVQRARSLPNLQVGLHLVLVDGAPTSPPERIPGLVDETGYFRRDLARFGIEIASRPALRPQLRAEITAQFESYWATGLPLDHVNAHKHFHLHPVVNEEVIAIGRRYGMHALRVPSEPRSVLRALGEDNRWGSAALLAPLTAQLRRRARRAGLRVADAVFGLAWSGALTPHRMAALLSGLPAGLIEIYTHPASRDDFHGASMGYAYTSELKALCDPTVIIAWRASGFQLGGYGTGGLRVM